MNVIVSNRQKQIIDNANIDAIKDLNGLFNVNDLINKFKNYFFSKMILDATSVVDFASREVLTTLANEIGTEKLIILLPSSPEPPLEFKKLLIELKIYNFTTDINDVVKFLEKSNTYEDAIKTIDNSFSNDVYVDNSIKDGDDTSLENNNSNSSNVINEPVNDSFGKSSLGDILNGLNYNIISDNSISDNSKNVSENSENFPNSIPEKEENVIHNDFNTNTKSNNIFLINDDYDNSFQEIKIDKPHKNIIGLKNITMHAGSTSLIYMLHKMITVNLNKDVLSIEVGKNDFRYFRDSKMISTSEDSLEEVINSSNSDLIFVDLNDCNMTNLCTQVLYLVEPSTIRLNELMATNRDVFKELKDKKVLLNKSLLSPNDIKTLESEADMVFFYNIEPLNDRIFNDSINSLLGMLDVK